MPLSAWLMAVCCLLSARPWCMVRSRYLFICTHPFGRACSVVKSCHLAPRTPLRESLSCWSTTRLATTVDLHPRPETFRTYRSSFARSRSILPGFYNPRRPAVEHRIPKLRGGVQNLAVETHGNYGASREGGLGCQIN